MSPTQSGEEAHSWFPSQSELAPAHHRTRKFLHPFFLMFVDSSQMAVAGHKGK